MEEEHWHTLTTAFMPEQAALMHELVSGDHRLVHYTSAEAAFRILDSQEVWLRSALVMNDFSEIRHGQACLVAAWKTPKAISLTKWLNNLYPGAAQELEADYDEHHGRMLYETYLFASSRHRVEECRLGKLSMWRAYGGRNGVAMVFNPNIPAAYTDALGAYSYPVRYAGPEKFVEYFVEWADRVMACETELRLIGRDDTLKLFRSMLRTFALCTKHEAFVEEQEWRAFYSPGVDHGALLTQGVEIIRGAPQIVYKVPLVEMPDKQYVGASIPNLIDKIIIGPVADPVLIGDAMAAALHARGVSNPIEKIVFSGIPLRHMD